MISFCSRKRERDPPESAMLTSEISIEEERSRMGGYKRRREVEERRAHRGERMIRRRKVDLGEGKVKKKGKG